MEIPKTLKPTWDKVANDGVITKADYSKLLVAAAPHNKDSEIDAAESKFLSSLKSELDSAKGAKGSVPVEGLSFINNTPPNVIKEKDLGEVPPTMKQAWNKSMADGKISQDEYKDLLHAASPNWSDSELDTKEKDFLSNLQALLKNTKEPLTVEKSSTPSQKADAPVTSPTSPAKASVPVSSKPVTTTQTNVPVPVKPTTQAPAQQVQPQQAPADDATTADTTTENPPEVKGESDQDIEHLNKIKTILASINDPDFTPLQGIVEQRITDNSSLKQFSSDVNTIMGSIKSGDKASLNQAKTQIQASYDKLSDGTKANPNVNNIFKYAMGSIDSQISGKVKPRPTTQQQAPVATNNPAPAQPTATTKPGVIPFVDPQEAPVDPATQSDNTTPATTTEAVPQQASILSDLGDVPDTLKSTWDNITTKGKITATDYTDLLKAAAPTGKDNELDESEKTFLLKLKTKLEANKGNIDLTATATSEEPTATSNSGTQDNQIAPSASTKPVLLNWPGYNAQTKGALKSAYGKDVTGTKMPLLTNKATKAVVEAFGVTNVSDLQKKVNAKVDGKFGPETFFQAKVYVANLMNNPGSDPEEIKKMLSALGNDDEVKKMQSQASNPTTSTEAPADSGMPVPQDPVTTPAETTTVPDATSPTTGSTPTETVRPTQNASPNKGATPSKPVQSAKPESSADGVPASLKTAWNKITATGKIDAKDYETLIKAAAPTGKDSEISKEELAFLQQVKTTLEQNGGSVKIQKPEANPTTVTAPAAKPTQTTAPATNTAPDDGVPTTLKATWKKVTADGKLTKEGYQQLVTAAAPHKKNSEFDNQELQFLGTIRDLFDKNKTEVLELNAPQAQKPKATPKPVSQSAPSNDGNVQVPSTLKAAWSKIIAKGKVTTDDYKTLIDAAAPHKMNSEFDNNELKFLDALKQKLSAANGTLVLKK